MRNMKIFGDGSGGITIHLTKEDVIRALNETNATKEMIKDPLKNLQGHTRAFWLSLKEKFGNTTFRQDDPFVKEMRQKHAVFDISNLCHQVQAKGGITRVKDPNSRSNFITILF